MSAKTLTAKQRVFVAEYLIDKNGKRAAIAAGYAPASAKSIASENLSKPYLWEVVEIGIKSQIDRAGLSADEMLDELNLEAFSDVYGGSHANKLRALDILGRWIGCIKGKNAVTDKHGGPQVVLTTTAEGQKSYREMIPLDSIVPKR